jgi:hypothetical protein
MDLNKHIVTNDTSKPFHSSGLARVANGDHVGSTSNVSFNQRQHIECNRRLVYGYNRSVLGGAYGLFRSNFVKNSSLRRATSEGDNQTPSSLGSAPRSQSSPETPARNYDPYNS